MATAPSSATTRRINKELQDLQQNPIQGIQITPSEDNLYEWTGIISGPKSSCYEGGKFHFRLTIPTEYPFKPPVFLFTTRIYHPNVDSDGNVCLSSLRPQNFKPSIRLRSVLDQLLGLLVLPNPEDPLVPSIASQYTTDPASFAKIARDYVQHFARK
ncbi:ubiquitin conjugating enzyme Ubc14 [Schizosaccharomyces japonicus yFS275]|uniref:E2 ubiquitin-conjugating enzyme n=1 Tax=Schizosaccharomyces japonicus (strain yFS275 / FY16936) TaxID=402676 RepID=B6K7R2_SCHJY|nr:ubiquitin conjugating enzyme Ubc14 [Schizosaccharomyces japonicus yFS275]EEB09566.1 ubiquitin conjugating enzyme Ubc14 [Schizosaccharomyces japonicus yFS275]